MALVVTKPIKITTSLIRVWGLKQPTPSPRSSFLLMYIPGSNNNGPSSQIPTTQERPNLNSHSTRVIKTLWGVNQKMDTLTLSSSVSLSLSINMMWTAFKIYTVAPSHPISNEIQQNSPVAPRVAKHIYHLHGTGTQSKQDGLPRG